MVLIRTAVSDDNHTVRGKQNPIPIPWWNVKLKIFQHTWKTCHFMGFYVQNIDSRDHPSLKSKWSGKSYQNSFKGGSFHAISGDSTSSLWQVTPQILSNLVCSRKYCHICYQNRLQVALVVNALREQRSWQSSVDAAVFEILFVEFCFPIDRIRATKERIGAYAKILYTRQYFLGPNCGESYPEFYPSKVGVQ